MPTASDDLRERWGHPDESVAEKFLELRGYELLKSWNWRVPENHTPTDDELSAVAYLCDEWDYGGCEYQS